MRIVVCVKHVPDVQAERVFGERGFLVRGDDDVLNELDENAVQEAVNLAGDDGEVIALTMGPEDAADGLRRALALGAHRAIHVCDDRAAGSDVLGTARVLAAAIRQLDGETPVDLVVTGMAALDGMTATIPSALAAHLDLPALTLAKTVERDGTTIRITRTMGVNDEVIEADLPAILSVTDQANAVTYPNFKAIMAAKKKPVTQIDLDDLGLGGDLVGAAGAGTRVTNAVERPPRAAGEIITDSGDGGTRLADYILGVMK
ncbi:electron transfer flavoprotein subunit beta/FixA family protein [Flaviflexus equikiangi]|uniref:Electron transfer flavoprotein subunit beta n=1 Tax=Flaviflexus equikiangi TaxID=2758573 RepID=A0ABS2TFM8_9ACTO|nr:electron transfer flavoprotein subunit beta/FixA family protein [Flaviflexus equikiangi]MBM9433459.1 electron transfer flavoprotein subunit beta/FixA family protein [Flaviflexus equikiangi]